MLNVWEPYRNGSWSTKGHCKGNMYLELLYLVICSFSVVRRSTASTNHADWMSRLPATLLRKPLRGMAIPGSHNSASYSINVTSDFAPSISNKVQDIIVASRAVKGGEKFVKYEVYRWSVTQSYNISQQLQLGIRYFDLRILYKDPEDKLYTYHGLIGAPLEKILAQMATFLQRHEKEVIFLDFNHLHNLPGIGLKKLRKLLLAAFGNKIYRGMNNELTLNDIWRNESNVIVFLRGVKQTNTTNINQMNVFNDSHLVSPFVESKFYDYSTWTEFLTNKYKNRPRDGTFYVTQGIMQPSILSIAASSLTRTGSLESLTSDGATKVLVQWLQTCKSGTTGINIVIADFVQKHKFIDTVLSLNRNFS